MALRDTMSRLGRRLKTAFRIDDPHIRRRALRINGVEELEPRQLMAGDLHVGAVYFEDASGDDTAPDIIQVTFEGGAPGTQLTRVTIDVDKNPQGLSAGDLFFDTAPGGKGVFGSSPLVITAHDGFTVKKFTVTDGGTKVVFDLEGFDAGEKLVFSVDVDETQFVDPVTGDVDENALVEGAEFQRSLLIANFIAPHHYDATGTATFWDFFDPNFAPLEQQSGFHLNLPNDAYALGQNPGGQSFIDRTAGGAVLIPQIPLPIQISGTVYEDHNANNLRNPGDQGISNVPLALLIFNGSTYVATGKTTTTDSQGNYKFEGLLPGKYRVVETQPAGYFSVGSTPGTVDGATRGIVVSPDILSEINLLGGDDSIHNDFAEVLPASISGNVHADLDGDCEIDPGEPMIEGVLIELLDAQGKVIDTTRTDVNGNYKFDNLMPGTYGIHEVQPAGYYDGGEDVGSAGGVEANDLLTEIFLGSGVDAVNYDFCEKPPASISGKVHADLDGDCEIDPGELMLEGVKIELLDANGNVLATKFTDANGFYKFDNLKPGEYGVREYTPAGYYDGGQDVGSAGGVEADDLLTEIVLGAGVDAVEYNFCEKPPASISGNVHADLDGDCEIDPDEPMIEGVKIELLDANGNVVATKFTDANGNYKFDNLKPGEYGVREYTPAGYFDGGQDVGSEGGVEADDLLTEIVLGAGVNAVEYNFCEKLPASISGNVHADLDGDCEIDPGELMLEGVKIELLDADGNVVATKFTDVNGNYKFDNLKPGEYGVREYTPVGYYDGGQDVGSEGGVEADDLLTEIVLGSGVDAVEYNFCEKPPASISGFVFVDLNSNCDFDPDESPIAGVTVRLFDADGNQVAITTTNANGAYSFTNLKPGVYSVAETQPAGYFNGCTEPGSEGGVEGNDIITEITLKPGRSGVNYNFGETPPGSISGYVFQDGPAIKVGVGETPNIAALRDGTLTADDKRLSGVVLELRDGVTGLPVMGSIALPGIYAAGQPIHTVTDANGHFKFVGLPAGNYAVFEVQPDGYIDSIDTPGTLGGVAINPSQIVPEFVLQSLDTGVDVKDDAILRIALFVGQDSVDNLFSEVVTIPERIIIPPPPDPAPPVALPLIINLRPPLILPPLLPPQLFFPEDLGGSGAVLAFTWHLSVVNAGMPRGPQGDENVVKLTNLRPDEAAFKEANLNEAEWTLGAELQGNRRAEAQRRLFGMRGAIPVTGDFNGDGVSDVGVYKDGHWFIDVNGNGVWDDADLWAKLGTRNDKPVTGDWDGDGKTDIGIYGPAWPGDPRAIAADAGIPDPDNVYVNMKKNMPPQLHEAAIGVRALKLTEEGKVRADLIDHVFHYGTPTDIPIIGDWNGDGIDTIAVFSGGTWYRDLDGDGEWSDTDIIARFGAEGDKPVVGDFNGDGIAELGIYRDGKWYLDTNGNHKIDDEDQVIVLGGPGDAPVVGDWDGDGRDEVGVYHNATVHRAVVK